MTLRSRAPWAVLPAVLTLVVGASAASSATGGSSDDPAAGSDASASAVTYDLLLRRGHVIDPKNNRDKVLDIAVKNGKIAAVGPKIDPSRAERTVDIEGKYLTPGLIDMHTHLFRGPEDAYSNGVLGVPPDGFTFRSGVTTALDTGSAGWENFDLFKKNIVDTSKTRVLSLLNIVGKGMAGGDKEQDLDNMDAAEAAKVAKKYPEIIRGIKTAHYDGPSWAPVERSVEAGEIAGIPAMIDFGSDSPERTIEELLTEKLRPGDIYSHVYSGLRGELGEDGKLNPALAAGRERGVLFDVGHGGGSFDWNVAMEGKEEGFWPDTISTDLHVTSMNAGMKDMSNVMSKFLTMGQPLKDVIEESTWKPAQALGRKDLGNLSVGSSADIAVFDLQKGTFGYTDSFGLRVDGKEKLVTELTVRAGEVVWDLNGRAAKPWKPGAVGNRTDTEHAAP
ncbi:amidohydrolase/deacetylase family metallohydrolase [Streptomyces sp. NPDC050433]|uniref:amidohydrolase/deacetylase family metallohydrolase n=1 Tax=Streptomyces sp. NPDC050433 TaxID=3365615 RepID=UPI00378D2FC8